MNEEKKEINKLRADLRYYKIANKEFKKQNSFLRYENFLVKQSNKRYKKQIMEMKYLFMELLEKEVINGRD